jgi:hypothetical protein
LAVPERGYTRADHASKELARGCECPEDFDHDGKCQNALRTKNSYKCPPCASGWHHPYPCEEYESKGLLTLNTQCDHCGWDSAEHPVSERHRALMVDARWKRDAEGRVIRPAQPS